MKTILIADVRGVIANGGYDVLNRHRDYGYKLKETNHEYQLKILSYSRKEVEKGFEDLLEVNNNLIFYNYEVGTLIELSFDNIYDVILEKQNA